MRKSYDFSNAVQGAHYKRYAQGHSVRLIDEEESQTPELACDLRTAENSLQKSDLISLDPDVKAAFADSQAVNEALRLLIKTAKSAQEFAKAS